MRCVTTLYAYIVTMLTLATRDKLLEKDLTGKDDSENIVKLLKRY